MRINKFFFIGMILLVASAISAQDVISVNDLAKIMKDKNTVIVSAGADDSYKVHITGAINVPHSTLCTNEPIRNLIKSPAEMAKELGAKGVSADKTIIVYDEGSTKYAGRMYWMLKYLGAPNVKMLNGNMTAWKAGRKPITGTPTKLPATSFTPKVDESVLAKMDEIKKAINNSSYVFIDARTPEEYAGTAETELRPGHIPGAVSINYETLADDKGMLKSNEALKGMFESKGITKDKTAIVYCETSVRAGIIFLVLKGLGYPNVKVYDGAYLEWQATASNKVD